MHNILRKNTRIVHLLRPLEITVIVALVASADWAFFMKNGSDATTFSVMCARAHTGKKKMLFLKGYYHGDFQWAQKMDYPGFRVRHRICEPAANNPL